MVGIPRSKGCRICVQRRVKCDQTRPTCKNCLKGNRPCPGYDSDLRIHDEGTKLRKRFGQKETTDARSEIDVTSPSTSAHSQSTESSPESSLELFSRNATPDAERADVAFPARNAFLRLVESQIYPDFDLSSPGSFNGTSSGTLSGGSINFDLSFEPALDNTLFSPFLAQEQLLSTFSHAISSTGPPIVPRQMQNHTRWLSQLPNLFGTKLLDTAVRAVSLVHLGRVQQMEVLIQESRKFYGKALRLLNQSITDDTRGMSTETLSATILLSFYEMFASDSNQSWVRHAGGAGALMRIRGPARHLSGIDRDVFLAYRHTIVIDAFQRDEACFLSEPEWLDLARQVHEDLRSIGMSGDRMEIFDLGEEFYMENVFIPTTLRDSRVYLDTREQLPAEQRAFYEESIRERCKKHRAKLKSINLRFRAAIKRLGLDTTIFQTADPVFPIHYRYVNVFIASNNVGYWTIMIILNALLKEMEKGSAPEQTGLYVMENREIAREICRSTPYMLTSSFLGPFFIIFALRLCLMVFDPGNEREWVLRKLMQIGQTHMKMASDIPHHEHKTTIFEAEKSVALVSTADPNEIGMDLELDEIEWPDLSLDV